MASDRRQLTITVTVARFPRRRIIEAVAALGWMRLVLRRRAGLSWWRLVGTGASAAGFGARPDWLRIGLVAVWDGSPRPIPMLDGYLARRAETVDRYVLRPVRWHGTWGGLDPLAGADRSRAQPATGAAAVITHGRIPLRLLVRFWRRVPAVAAAVMASPGFRGGFGFGSVPLVALATFSLWDDHQSHRAFAFEPGPHADVIAATRREGWFREEFFAVLEVVDGSARQDLP